MIIIKDNVYAKKIKKMRDYGKVIGKNGVTRHLLPAFPNARLNEYSATVANTILKHYSYLVNLKKEIANFYDNEIDNNLIFSKIYKKNTNVEFSYYKYICYLQDSKYKTAQVYDKDNQLISILKDNDLNFEFFGDKEFAREHICLPITYSMNLMDAQEILNNTI